MEKTFQMDNTDVNAIHDRLTGELQSNGFEVVRDEPRDNGFKVLVRRGEEHGEVEVFNDWGAVRLITHGRLEWELMNIAEPLFNQPGGPAPSQPSMQPPQAPQQFPRPMPPYPTAQGYQSSMPQLTQPQSPQPTQPMYHPVPQFPQEEALNTCNWLTS